MEPVGRVREPFDNAITKMGSLGATILDPVDIPTLDQRSRDRSLPSTRPELAKALRFYLGVLKEAEAVEETTR